MTQKNLMSNEEVRRIILEMLCEGAPSNKIASVVELSEHTVNNYIKALSFAYGAKNRLELAVKYTKSLK